VPIPGQIHQGTRVPAVNAAGTALTERASGCATHCGDHHGDAIINQRHRVEVQATELRKKGEGRHGKDSCRVTSPRHPRGRPGIPQSMAPIAASTLCQSHFLTGVYRWHRRTSPRKCDSVVCGIGSSKATSRPGRSWDGRTSWCVMIGPSIVTGSWCGVLSPSVGGAGLCVRHTKKR